MKPITCITALILFALLPHGAALCAEPEGAVRNDLASGFAAPPHEAKPWVYWWFEGGYGNPQGMARDIAAMRDKGLGGVMHMQTINAGGLSLPEQPKMLGPEWDAWFGEMLRVAHEGGMTLSASILDGWSHGGWWVGEEDGAKQLVYSETQVDGPAGLAGPLPQPLTRLELYRDVAVVAFPERTRRPLFPLVIQANNVHGGYCNEENWPAAHAVDGDPQTDWRTQTGCTPDKPAVLDLRYAQPLRAVAALVAGMPGAGPAEAEIQASEDGKTFRPVVRFAMQPGDRQRVEFPPLTATHFRLAVFRAHAPDLQLAEFAVLRSGDEPVLRPGIRWWDYKSGNRAWWGWPLDPYGALEEEYAGDDASDLSVDAVVDLTARLGPDGLLDWQPPPGRWTILRFGWTPLAEPARMGSGGYEVDVLNLRGADLMMDTVAQRMRDLSVKQAGGAAVIFHTDSWEIGAGGKGQQPTWTENFAQQFQQRRGYDLVRYLPALARRVVDDRETTNRFLRDYRDTIADLLADYYGRLQQRAHQLQGGINAESGYGSYPHPHMDGLRVFGRSDRPMAEFWHPFGKYQDTYMTEVDIMRTAASGARIYGNRFVQAETLTFHPTAGLNTPPEQYRRTLHEAWTRGLNQAVIHKFTHQPFEDPPGMLDYDIFNRHFSWWPLADGLIGYMGRCQYLLQEGDFVADAAYFVGEGASRFVPGKEYLRPALPWGFDYDGVNAEVLLGRMSVQDGYLTLPAGSTAAAAADAGQLRYRYLVLCQPQCRTLSPAVLEKIRDLVHAGATVVGPPPQAAPGLTDREAADARIKSLASELWGPAPGAQGQRQLGSGRVLWGRSMADILAADGLPPDVEIVAENEPPKRADLAGASWIWHAADGRNPPPCERSFRSTIDIPAGRKVAAAWASMTADNGFVLSVNGTQVCRGDNFHELIEAPIDKTLLHAGRNEILVRATNAGDGPNPAGLVGKVVITLDDGSCVERQTEVASWQSSADGQQWADASLMGPLGCAPWGPIEAEAMPEVSLAWIHRRCRDADIYFLANSLPLPVEVTVSLRSAGKNVRLFEPLDGSARDLPERIATPDGRTQLPLRFAPHQAYFVVLGAGPDNAGTGRNFPHLKTAQTVEGPWQVTFDARWVKPLPASSAADAKDVALTFRQLEDWSRHPEEGIRSYSGLATYRTRFDLAAPEAGARPMYIDVGQVKELARVSLNGRELGVAWCPPWRVRVPRGVLQTRGNELVITVANTWHNRLGADHALPEHERLTQIGHNIHARSAQGGLRPSGLLGPVRLITEE